MVNTIDISLEALSYIKQHRRELINQFANLDYYYHDENPASYFMAGAPGAGKTEYSKSFIKQVSKRDSNIRIVRIDPDEIRDIFPSHIWTGCNADEIVRGTSKGVEILHDFALHNSLNFLMDGTLSKFDTSYKNVTLSLSKKRKVGIYYVYQNPLTAWKFTKIREMEEGRHVPKSVFIDSLYSSIENVNKIKKELGNEVTLSLIIKDIEHKVEKYFINIDNIDSYIDEEYNMEALSRLLE